MNVAPNPSRANSSCIVFHVSSCHFSILSSPEWLCAQNGQMKNDNWKNGKMPFRKTFQPFAEGQIECPSVRGSVGIY
jgi:hypothetical protein